MKHGKKAISIITVLLSLFGMFRVEVSAETFSDVPSWHWAYDYINDMHNRNILMGFGDGLFKPNEKITRGQFSVVLTHLVGAEYSDIFQFEHEKSFADTSKHWCQPYAEAMKEYFGGINQNGTNYFYPDKEATREEIAVAFVKIKGYDISDFDDTLLGATFTDWQSVLPGAKAYIAAAVTNGILSGYEDGTIRPHQGISRAELAALACKVYPNTITE